LLQKKGGEGWSTDRHSFDSKLDNYNNFKENLSQKIDWHRTAIKSIKELYKDDEMIRETIDAERTAFNEMLADMYITDFLVYTCLDTIAKQIKNNNAAYMFMEVQLKISSTTTTDEQIKKAILFDIYERHFKIILVKYFNEDDYSTEPEANIKKTVEKYVDDKLITALSDETAKRTTTEFCDYVAFVFKGDYDKIQLSKMIELKIIDRIRMINPSGGGRKIVYEKRLKSDLIALAKSKQIHVVQSMTKTHIIALLRKQSISKNK